MADLNTWWDKDSDERFWLEITDRDDLGADLLAPKQDDAGREYWSYNLLTEVRQGDVILHWHKSLMGVPAIVGWSVADGRPEDSTIVWQARGTAGRRHEPSGEEPAWRVPLTGYAPLLDPVDQDALRREEPELRAVHDRVLASHARPLYFPFAFSEKRPVRTAQGYLVKFPAALLEVFPELDAVPRPTGASRPPKTPPKPPGSDGHQSDSVVRKAIETHAVDMAISYFAELGYEVENVGSFRSFDLLVSSSAETRHVEVKGSVGSAEAVELTHGEVANARDHQPTDLFVVSDISWWREPDGSVQTDGGDPRVLHDWTPAEADLQPVRFRYTVPTDW